MMCEYDTIIKGCVGPKASLCDNTSSAMTHWTMLIWFWTETQRNTWKLRPEAIG